MKNVSNKEVNILLKKNHLLYRRVGSCKDCNGRCCSFIVLSRMSPGLNAYWQAHGSKIVKDKWDGVTYLVRPSQCANLTADSGCKHFDHEKKFPSVCAKFPMSPEDHTYRYLVQRGTPCGYSFVDAKTKKPWSLKRKQYYARQKKQPQNVKEQLKLHPV